MRETHSYEENGAHNLVLGHYHCIAKWRYKGRRVVVLIQQCDCHGNPGDQCRVAVVLSSDGEDQSLIFLAIQHSSCTGEDAHTVAPVPVTEGTSDRAADLQPQSQCQWSCPLRTCRCPLPPCHRTPPSSVPVRPCLWPLHECCCPQRTAGIRGLSPAVTNTWTRRDRTGMMVVPTALFSLRDTV